MRSQLVARRIILAPALALTLVAAVAACSSSSSSSSSSTGATSAPASSSISATPVPASTSASASGNSAAVAQITANWEKFFNSSTSNSDRVALLQNGNAFSGAISGLISLAPGLGAKVINVTVNSATSATVTYNLTAGGTSLFTSSQTGKAVYENGVWKVGDASLCSLLQLVPGGTVPAACNSVS
jgi:hypothetical protein